MGSRPYKGIEYAKTLNQEESLHSSGAERTPMKANSKPESLSGLGKILSLS